MACATASQPPSRGGGEAARGFEAGGAAADVFVPELPVELVRRILRPLAGRWKTLSAAACVCRAWRAATAEPALWRSDGLSDAFDWSDAKVRRDLNVAQNVCGAHDAPARCLWRKRHAQSLQGLRPWEHPCFILLAT